MKWSAGVIALVNDKWALTTLLVGLLLSAGLGYQVHINNQDRINNAARESSELAIQSVLSRVELYQYGLRGARGAILAAGEKNTSRSAFHLYSLTRNPDTEFPGARGFGFIRRVSPEDEAQFLQEARQDGWPDFNIRELSTNPGTRYVIQYIEPVDKNMAAVGLDIASERNRRLAAESSMTSGEVRLTGPITLVQATGKPKQSFLILLPIYAGGSTPATLFDRQQTLFGWSYAPLIMEDVLSDIRMSNKELLSISDITEPGHTVPFYQDTAEDEKGLNEREEIRKIFGRTWKFSYSIQPSFIESLNLPNPYSVALVTTVISILLSILVGVIKTNLTNRRRLHSEQAKLSAIVESSGDGIIGKALDGTIISWNRGAEQIFGYSRKEAIGNSILELVIPADRQSEELAILERIANGESIPHFETIRHRKDGAQVQVSVTVSPIYSENNKIIGASKTVRDISLQKEAEAKIHDLNTSLERQVEERTSELATLNVLFNSVLTAATEVSIIATDINGVIQLFNHGAERLLGYKASEVVGRFTPAIIHDETEVKERSEELSSELGMSVEGFRVFVQIPEMLGAETREWTYIRKDGSHFPVMLVVTPMRTEQGEIQGYLGIATDITEQKEHQEELLETQAQLLSTTDQLLMASEVAELGIWTLKLADNSLQWNDKMYALYEHPVSLRAAGLYYSHWNSRLHPEDLEHVTTQLSEAIAGKGKFDPVFRLNLPSGSTRFIQAGAYVERDYKGQAIKVIGINRDITSERELESGLRKAKIQADEASAAKSMFLANMSHEIRTPMNAVLGMLQLVRNTQLTPRQNEYTTKAHIAATSLLSLLNDILDYSKMDAGKLILDSHPFSVEELMSDLAIVLSANLGHKNVELLFDIDPQLPSHLLGDRLRLQQVLINLASNAIKFTSDGEVVVKVQLLEPSENARAHIRISVSDTGIGISPEQLTRIFEGFTQAEASTTRRFGGTGLGLVISKHLVNLMGGELLVESEPGQGSRFWFDIALPVESNLPLLRDVISRQGGSLNVLVVDDNRTAREIISKTVLDIRATVYTADSGPDALNRLQRNNDIQVILMDWNMPGMSGIDTAKAIRNQNQSHPIIVMITAFGREESFGEGDSLPFDAFLTKPVTPTLLANTIAKAMSREKAGESKLVTPTKSQLPLQDLQLLLVEDNEFNRQVASELLINEGATVDLAEGGLEGVNQVVNGPRQYDLVLMDMQMPDIDGLEATRQIRADGRFDTLPIVAMTANVSIADQEACLEAGMNSHLGKPLNLPKVIETILLHTGRLGESPAPLSDNQSLATSVSTELTEDETHVIEPLEAILARFGGNEKLYRSLVKDFEANLQKQLSSLKQAVEQREWSALLSSLHTLKGTSGTIGLSHLYTTVISLEEKFKTEANSSDDTVRLALSADLVASLSEMAHDGLTQLHETLTEDSSQGIPPPATGETVNEDELNTRLAEMQEYLNTGNLKAIDIAEELQVILAARPAIQGELLALLEAAEALDFEKAQTVLTKLTQKL